MVHLSHQVGHAKFTLIKARHTYTTYYTKHDERLSKKDINVMHKVMNAFAHANYICLVLVNK